MAIRHRLANCVGYLIGEYGRDFRNNPRYLHDHSTFTPSLAVNLIYVRDFVRKEMDRLGRESKLVSGK